MKKPSHSCDSLKHGHGGILFCSQTSRLSYWVLLCAQSGMDHSPPLCTSS